LLRRIAADFPQPGSAGEVASIVDAASDSERVQAAIVLASRGDVSELRRQCDLATVDWRDVLVNGGLAHDDWRERLDTTLGSDV
jgi:hypothetical protein